MPIKPYIVNLVNQSKPCFHESLIELCFVIFILHCIVTFIMTSTFSCPPFTLSIWNDDKVRKMHKKCLFIILPSSWTHYPPPPPQVSSRHLKAKRVPCRGKGGNMCCQDQDQTKKKEWEDDCVDSNPTSPLTIHTVYTNPHTLIKGILGHNREDGTDCNKQSNMAWRCLY